ncbi:NUDIX hydrolase [Umezawaea sp. Da 62-37]|uniref:NUDIX hydrolase n=1 Tax=Umezawaea sp. Da 62-37 TaxID=3075927 RepID=UPI0028F73F81|nr:NUDIX hydrolase [Umezawaea sp. Da 62-37]WNV83079.1 NUDIX hydrolase [Umezawaea sp. Da 62-37]
MSDDLTPERWAYLAEGNREQARKRVAAKVVIRDRQGRVLLVDPNYKPRWDLPGGMVEANEAPREAARRECREELGGGIIEIGRLLLMDWEPAHGPWDDQLMLVFDGGIVETALAATLHVTDPELDDLAWFTPDEAVAKLRQDVGDRLQRALHALATHDTAYAEREDRTSS